MAECRNLSPIEKCLAFIAHGVGSLQVRNLQKANVAFALALAAAKASPPEQAHSLVPLALLHVSRLRKKEDRHDEARQLREEADLQIEQHSPNLPDAFFNLSMAAVLMDLEEYRRAIPFWEKLIEVDDSKEPLEMAYALSKVGECYNRIGLKDHAAIPLRAAVKTFRKHPEDPRLASALITLGNALRKSAPMEAESFYREVADLHVAKGRLLSATPAWGNIAILYSEQGRYAESLELFEKVSKIREQSPGVPVPAFSVTLNNIANCYRRMGKFPEAVAAVSRAIDLLKDHGGEELAQAYSTRGLIFLDQEQNADAVEWLRKAYEYHQKLPSPRMDSVVDDLDHEIEALKRLGRADELKDAEGRLAATRTTMRAVPEVSRDLGALDAPMQNAVFVELNIGILEQRFDTKREDVQLGRRTGEDLEVRNIGCYAGRIATAESTTLLFYGPDAEVLFQALEPMLVSEPICAGARITIRQQDSRREIMLPSRLT
jgi:tetratricopeptide (TPR) repeat protein